jgi:hypothetical protein
MITATPTTQISAAMMSKRSGRNPAGDHAPGQAAGDEDAATRGKYAAEVGVGLPGGHEPVGAERHHLRADSQQARGSPTLCRSSHAPPNSASAATTNKAMERATVMPATCWPL